jgi:ornithine decarboxylase
VLNDQGIMNRLDLKLQSAGRALRRLETPFFLFDTAEVDYSLDLFRRHLPEVSIFYAVKANDDLLLLKYLRDRGCRFDVASIGEIRRILSIGMKPCEMIFANPVKSPQSIEEAFRLGIRAYTFDNPDEVRKLAAAAERLKLPKEKLPSGLIRIRTQSKDVVSDLSSKFGCPVGQAVELIEYARAQGLKVDGIAFHVGTQSHLSSNHARAFDDVEGILRELKQKGLEPLRILDIGGGFPCDTGAGAGVLLLESLFADIGNLLRRPAFEGMQFWSEPGRSIAGPASSLVIGILGRRDTENGRFLHMDDGVFGGLSAAINDYMKFRFLPLRKGGKPFHPDQWVPFTLFGPTCDSFDKIEQSVLLPADIGAGDYLLVPDVGAYSRVTAATFNGFPVPQRFVVRKKRIRPPVPAIAELPAAALAESLSARKRSAGSQPAVSLLSPSLGQAGNPLPEVLDGQAPVDLLHEHRVDLGA